MQVQGSMFRARAVLADSPPQMLNGLTSGDTRGVDAPAPAAPGTGPGFVDDGKLSPEEGSAIAGAIKSIFDGVANVVNPPPAPKVEKKGIPAAVLIGGGVVVVVLAVFLLRKK